MIDKRSVVGQFLLDIPVPEVKQHEPPPDWHPIDDLPELDGYVALDVETHDPGLTANRGSSWSVPDEGILCGFSIAPISGSAFYAPIAHAGGNGDGDKYLAWLRAQARKPSVTFVYANAIYDIGWCHRYGIDSVNLPMDIQCMASLLDGDRRSYSLDSLMQDFLGKRKSTADLYAAARARGIMKPYQHMHRLPAWEVAPYGVDDGVGTIGVFQVLLPMIEAQGLQRVHELERECILVGHDLQALGVRANLDRVAQVTKDFMKERDDAIARIREQTGVAISPTDPQSIARALEAEGSGVELERTSRGIPSIRIGVLDALGTPVAKEIRRARKFEKSLNTYLVPFEHYVARDGRVHAEFNPYRRSRDAEEGGSGEVVGAGPGRWSCQTPNLQNVPRRDPEIGVPIRSCYEAEPGERWAKADYASQEPRLTTHFAALVNVRSEKFQAFPFNIPPGRLRGAQEMVDRYNANPTLSLHKEVAAMMGLVHDGMDKVERQAGVDTAKRINLGLIYGMQGKRFCQEMGLPTKWIEKYGRQIEVAGDEGQRLLDMHHDAVPFIRDLYEISKAYAEERGYCLTISGRRIRFNRRDLQGRRLFTHKSLNNSVQGSAADQTKMAQVAMRREGIPILVAIHDDVNFSLPKGEEGDRRIIMVQEIMRDAVTLLVPSLADVEIGDDWGEVSKPH